LQGERLNNRTKIKVETHQKQKAPRGCGRQGLGNPLMSKRQAGFYHMAKLASVAGVIRSQSFDSFAITQISLMSEELSSQEYNAKSSDRRDIPNLIVVKMQSRACVNVPTA